MDQLLDNEAHREHAMTPDPRAVEIIRDALRDSMWEGSEHPGEHFLSDGDVPGAADRIARWLADAGWSLLPPGRQSEPLGWVVLIQDPNGTRYDDWDGVVH